MDQRRYGHGSGAFLMAAATTGLMICATGCTADGPPAGDARPATETIRILHRAAAALVDAGTSRATTSMEMATGGTRVTIRGEGVYDYTKQLGRLKVLLPRTRRAPARTARSPNSSPRAPCS